jgi:purine-binding chemotaxis protein CheW
MSKSETQTMILTSGANQYLTFTLGEEEYGLDILKVQEIKGYDRATPLPDSPPCVKGVINLRGTVVPVVDVRSRFSMGEVAEDGESVVIVVTIDERLTGLLVDAVKDVLTILEENIQPAPEITRGADSDLIGGIGQFGERMVTLLDIERVLGEEIATA